MSPFCQDIQPTPQSHCMAVSSGHLEGIDRNVIWRNPILAELFKHSFKLPGFNFKINGQETFSSQRWLWIIGRFFDVKVKCWTLVCWRTVFYQNVLFSLLGFNTVVNTIPLIYIGAGHKQSPARQKSKYLVRTWPREYWNHRTGLLRVLVKTQEGQIFVSGNTPLAYFCHWLHST